MSWWARSDPRTVADVDTGISDERRHCDRLADVDVAELRAPYRPADFHVERNRLAIEAY